MGNWYSCLQTSCRHLAVMITEKWTTTTPTQTALSNNLLNKWTKTTQFEEEIMVQNVMNFKKTANHNIPRESNFCHFWLKSRMYSVKVFTLSLSEFTWKFWNIALWDRSTYLPNPLDWVRKILLNELDRDWGCLILTGSSANFEHVSFQSSVMI